MIARVNEAYLNGTDVLLGELACDIHVNASTNFLALTVPVQFGLKTVDPHTNFDLVMKDGKIYKNTL